MKRDLAILSDRRFDLLVVGGGIQGAFAAWDAALRGLSVALIEKADFGAATSANSLKIIHGGIRHLQRAELRSVRQSIRERSYFLRIAPHLVRPLPVLIPTYRGRQPGRQLFRMALAAYDVIGFDRDALAGGRRILPRGRILTRAETQDLFGGFERSGLTGGALWYDGQVVDSERLALACLASANERGAVLANYVEATGLLTSGSRVEGVQARDRAGSREGFEVRARVVLNSTGPWSPFLFPQAATASPALHRGLARAINLVTRRVPLEVGVGFRSKRGNGGAVGGAHRYLFAAPWRDATLLGTHYTVFDGEVDDHGIGEEHLVDFIDELNEACPSLELSLNDVTAYHVGLLPRSGAGREHADCALASRARIVDHSNTGGPAGLITIRSVKYTGARLVAQQAIDRVFDALGLDVPHCRTGETPIWGGEPIPDPGASPARERLASVYGSRWSDVALACPEDSDWNSPTSAGGLAPLRCQVLWAIRREMALRLSDVVFRRTQMGVVARPPDDILEAVSRIMGRELGWDEQRRIEEVDAVVRSYLPLNYRASR